MLVSLKYDTKHRYMAVMSPTTVPVEQSNRVSNAISEVLRGAGVPYPGGGLDYASLRFSVDNDVLALTYIRHNYDSVEYDNVTQRADSVEALIHRSAITSGIHGVVAESIRFIIEED
jgi:hypothetical protein